MSELTPILKLVVPAFDQTPWDQDIRSDLYVLDAAVGKFFGVANLVGVWMNATSYTAGQVVVDNTDGSMWSCVIANTSAVAPTTFAQDRVSNPSYWIQAASTAQDYATQAQGFASSAAASASAAAASAAAVAGALPLTGGTMTGAITLAADPAAALQPATKQYVDARVGGVGFLPTTGGTLTGFLTLSANPTANLHAATKQYADLKLALTGGTLTGALNGTSVAMTSTIHGVGGVFVDAAHTFGNYTGSGLRAAQFSSGYFWQWNTASGDLFWNIASNAFWYMRTSDRTTYNLLGVVGGNGAYVNLSDERTKHDIAELEMGMLELRKITPIRFTRDGKDEPEIGFSAQDIEPVIPEAISIFKDDLMAVSGDMILAVAVNAIKQLDARLLHLEDQDGT